MSHLRRRQKFKCDYQGVQSPERMKFPEFSLSLKSNVGLRLFRGCGDMLPQRIFKIRMLRLAEDGVISLL